jgi:uncharacterized protein (TIGR02118 family)
MLIKLTILYRKPADLDAFEAFYNENLALMEQLPGIVRRQANLVFGAPGGESEFHRVLELYFADRAALDTALRSEAGQAAGRHLMSRAAELAVLFFSEVYEEVGGHTDRPLEAWLPQQVEDAEKP